MKAVEATILAVGIAVMGWLVKAGIDDFAYKDRHVTVKGLSEREVPADKVTWSISTKCMGNDLPALYEQVKQNNTKVKAYLAKYGLSDSEITVGPPDVSDLEANQWSENRKMYRYIISSTVTVISKKIEPVNNAIQNQGDLVQQGLAVEAGYPSYEYVSFQKMKPEMMEEAISNAQKTAQQFAKNCNTELGDLQYASQGQFEIDDLDSNTPHIKQLRVVSTVTYSLK